MEMFLDYGVLVSGGLLLFVAFTSKHEPKRLLLQSM